ncbi:hypothetical protein TCAL_17002 [Tigriopus californicus]|uniref:Uncharacterized protein n=1 Tax=Tigriopus californicus TaxID=6832 RepID=A0A553PFM0_TIGCA|nr:hypothetical protein TCAL_17002 [Tigriopus californicus]
MAVVVGPGRKGPMIPLDSDNSTGLNRPTFECNQDDHTSAIILITLGVLGVGANVALMAVILFSKHLRRQLKG